jgi:hypothetical protein
MRRLPAMAGGRAFDDRSVLLIASVDIVPASTRTPTVRETAFRTAHRVRRSRAEPRSSDNCARFVTLIKMRTLRMMDRDASPEGRCLTMKHGDVIIRRLPGHEFLVANAVTLEKLGGLFTTFDDALAAALLVAPSGTIWQDNLDNRGRPLGPPIRVS